MPPIGIVIVTWNSEAEIGSCLDAALSTGAEIVVVDNASADRTCEAVRRRGVKLLANSSNRGFAAAVNQGITELATPYILLLNPDTVIQTPIDALRLCCERPATAGAGGKLIDPAGRPQAGFMFRRLPSAMVLAFEVLGINRIWPRNPVNWHYRCSQFDFSAETEVEQPAGAFLMIRREVWEKLGGFDEGFSPLWFEDVDFCRRARLAGYRMYYIPEVVAKHTGGHSIPKIAVEIRPYYWYGSLLRYSAKHFRPWGARGVCLAVILGSFLRLVSGIIFRRSRKPIAAYGRVIRLAARYFVSGRRDVGIASFSGG